MTTKNYPMQDLTPLWHQSRPSAAPHNAKQPIIAIIVGTRPEVIKLAPVIMALNKENVFICKVIATHQHDELLIQALDAFNIKPDISLPKMAKNLSLAQLTSCLLLELDKVFREIQPSVVIAQGDTTSVLSASLAAYYQKIPFYHVEAGLRSKNLFSPFPEEANRILSGKLAHVHFAPTESARLNLLNEGLPEHQIHMTGNTIVDALMYITNQYTAKNTSLYSKKLLVTTHRRENWDKLAVVCAALILLIKRHPDLEVIYPMHPNPKVKDTLISLLSGYPQIRLVAALEYIEFISELQTADVVLTDSGGVQEEATILGKPLLVLRNETERVEGIEAGLAQLVGIDQEKIIASVSLNLYSKKINQKSLVYGDGQASERIVHIIKQQMGLSKTQSSESDFGFSPRP